MHVTGKHCPAFTKWPEETSHRHRKTPASGVPKGSAFQPGTQSQRIASLLQFSWGQSGNCEPLAAYAQVIETASTNPVYALTLMQWAFLRASAVHPVQEESHDKPTGCFRGTVQ